jgi:hypothetical protein
MLMVLGDDLEQCVKMICEIAAVLDFCQLLLTATLHNFRVDEHEPSIIFPAATRDLCSSLHGRVRKMLTA